MTDERNDDELLGRALSRAIETQAVPETSYERSRLAVRPLRRAFPLWQTLGVAAALVLAVAFGAWFTRPTETLPAGASATPTASAAPTATAAAAATAVPASATPRTSVDHGVVYWARDGLPPVGIHIGGIANESTAPERIAARLTVLARNVDLTKFPTHDDLSAGAHNVFPTTSQIGVVSEASVKIQGDLATVDFSVPGSDWKVRGAAQSLALLQELVYTATEEPGIRRVLITENGGDATHIDQVAVDRALTREDVFAYSVIGPVDAVSQGGAGLPPSGQRGYQTEAVVGTSLKLTIQAAPEGTSFPTPAFVVGMNRTQGDLEQMGKYVLTIVVGSTKLEDVPSSLQTHIDDTTPLRATLTAVTPTVIVEELVLDDARPWRVYADRGNVVVELGGDPRMVSDRISVTYPTPALTLSRTFTIKGSARTFEANVVWRVKDPSGKVVAQDHTTASLGTSAVWGTFSTQVTLPANVTGNATLEVYEVSPKDGSEQGLVSIPLVVR